MAEKMVAAVLMALLGTNGQSFFNCSNGQPFSFVPSVFALV
jgi:hypothetical protein